MKTYIKSVSIYLFITILGVAFSYAVVQTYFHLTKEKPFVVADTTEHFKDTKAKIVMYSASWCPICTRARAYFDSNKIEYTDYDIETSQPFIIDRYKTLGANSVPMIIIEQKIFRGFQKDIIENEITNMNNITKTL